MSDSKDFNEIVRPMDGLQIDDKYKMLIQSTMEKIIDSNEIKVLEEEWSRYKYLVLEYSHTKYLEIRSLLKDKKAYRGEEFIKLVCEALVNESHNNSKVNSVEHVWGYFKKLATLNEKNEYKELLMRFRNNEISIKEMKKFLYSLTTKYKEVFLKNSYYFIDMDG